MIIDVSYLNSLSLPQKINNYIIDCVSNANSVSDITNTLNKTFKTYQSKKYMLDICLKLYFKSLSYQNNF